MTRKAAGELVRVMVVDDHAFVRDALGAALNAQAGLSLVAACASGAEAIRDFGRLTPDVIVVDFALGDMNGSQIVDAVRASGAKCRFVLLTGTAMNEKERAALAARVEVFLHKESGFERLVEAVWTAAYAPPMRPSANYEEGLLAAARLTPRERAVVRALAAGLPVAETAARLTVSPATVRKHRENAMAKLNVNSTAALVRIALQLGWA